MGALLGAFAWVWMMSAYRVQAQRKPLGQSSAEAIVALVETMHIYVGLGNHVALRAPRELKNTYLRSRSTEIGIAYPMNMFGTKHVYALMGAAVRRDALDWRAPHYFKSHQSPDKQLALITDDYDNVHKISVNRLQMTQLTLPIAFLWASRANPNRGFQLSIGGAIGYVVDTRQKIKYRNKDQQTHMEKHKHAFPIQPLQYELETRMGYHGLSLYWRYKFSSLFKTDQGPSGSERMRYMSIGVRINP